MINEKIKEKYPSIKFQELEKYKSYYDDKYYSRLEPKLRQNENVESLHLGMNGIKFLLLSLQRSRLLFDGFINALNSSEIPVAFLAVRAHYETTGSVSYFLINLHRYYANECTFEKIDDILRKLSLGSRDFPERDNNRDSIVWPDAINVLTQIEKADYLFGEWSKSDVEPFSNSYNLLSEFCHPNLGGLTLESYIEKGKGDVVFEKEPIYEEHDYRLLVSKILVSCGFFFIVYDNCFLLIKENEVMPILIK
jgi:hypothetical protein